MRFMGKLVLIMALVTIMAACSTARFAQTGKAYPAYTGTVQILRFTPTDVKYEEVGVVTVDSGLVRMESQMMDALRAKAAAYGANAVIITHEGYVKVGDGDRSRTPDAVAASPHTMSISGIAIRLLEN
jgi:type IV pilus biogenesis protein CpaD/CtpE